MQPAKRDQITGAVGRSNRFGFRQNTVRPASVGLTPKINEFDNDNVNNNNEATITDDKKRSKSASAASRATVTALPVNQQPPVKYNLRTTNLTYQQQQQAKHMQNEIKVKQEPINDRCTIVKTDLHTNSM